MVNWGQGAWGIPFLHGRGDKRNESFQKKNPTRVSKGGANFVFNMVSGLFFYPPLGVDTFVKSGSRSREKHHGGGGLELSVWVFIFNWVWVHLYVNVN